MATIDRFYCTLALAACAYASMVTSYYKYSRTQVKSNNYDDNKVRGWRGEVEEGEEGREYMREMGKEMGNKRVSTG